MKESTCAALLFSILVGCATESSVDPLRAAQDVADDNTTAAIQHAAESAVPRSSAITAGGVESPGTITPARSHSLGSDAPSSAGSPGSGSGSSVGEQRPTKTSWGAGDNRSYFIPAIEILAFEFLLNDFNRHNIDSEVYGSNGSSISHNLRTGWVIDHDPFATNQFGHPYQGSIYHTLARSAGLNYWESLGYTFVGSFAWEIAGETGPPSLNDQITTTFGGSFLGEVLFRIANLFLEDDGTKPGFFRELLAAIISPSTGFNRLAFGSRFDGLFPSKDPAVFTTVGAGARHNGRLNDPGVLGHVRRDEAIANFTMDYGLPGKPGYEYNRPFDYFHFEATGTSNSHAIPENISARGLLYGTSYDIGDSYRGIWGLYGSYDYFAPELFSVSSTALSAGSTGQWSPADGVALQGCLLGGVGWTGVGNIANAETDSNYHYGYSPQALMGLRLIFGELAMLDLTGREYHVVSVGDDHGAGNDNVLRGQVSLTVRVWGHHALTLQFVASSRDANFSDLQSTLQNVGAVSVLYTYLGDTRFGNVDWH